MRNVFKKFISEIYKDTSINYILLEKINDLFILNLDGVIVKKSFSNLYEISDIFDQPHDSSTNNFKHSFYLKDFSFLSLDIDFEQNNDRELLDLSFTTESGTTCLSYQYIKKNDTIVLLEKRIYGYKCKINMTISDSKITLYDYDKYNFNEANFNFNNCYYTVKFENGLWNYQDFTFDNKILYNEPESIEEELSLNYDIELPIAEGINAYHKCYQELKDYSYIYINEN